MEEISLKEIIEILLKGIKSILLVSLVVTAIAFIYGLSIPKVFTSEAVLKVNSININPAVSGDGVAAIAQFPVMDINSYVQMLTNNQVLESVVNELDLRGNDGELIKPEALKDKIDVVAEERNNVIYITVGGNDPDVAANITNTLISRFVIYLTDVININCADSMEAIEKQLDIQKRKIDIETERLKAYSEGSYNALELESSIDSLISQIVRYKTDINDMQRQLQADRMAITTFKSAEVGLFSDEFKISIPSDEYGRYSDSNNSVISAQSSPSMAISVNGGVDVKNAILAVKKAELETRLVQNEAEYNSLVSTLADMENNLAYMQGILADERQKYGILLRDYQFAGDIYGKYQSIYQQIPVIASADLARKNIQVLSSGLPASSPDNKSIYLYIVIGIVLGLFMGIFTVLFKNYWVNG